MTAIGRRYNASFQQTMLRIKDPKVSVPFYERHFGMKLVHRYDFPQWKFSLYFLERPRDAAAAALPSPGTKASEAYLWSMTGTTLELTHNHGSEENDSFSVWSGNCGSDLPAESPLFRAGVVRGFGHIAFNVEDVYAMSAALEAAGVAFQKRPDEGRMKGLAFCLDPDGYWIELVKREEGLFPEPQNLSQTMMRVKDADRTIHFYRDILGMDLVRAMHIPGDFTNYFFANLTPAQREAMADPESAEARAAVKTLWQPVLELTHNHGTEKDDAFHVHTGNSEPLGFGHIGFLKPAGRGEGLLIAGERRASFSRLPRRRPRGNVQGDGAGGRPLPQEAAGRRHEQPRIRPRPERLPGRARAARRLVRRRVLQLLRSGGRGPACAARQRHAVSRLFGSLPFPRPGARRARGVRPTADAATPGPRVHCSLFHNWPRSRHCARAFVQRKPNTCTLCPSASANMHTLRGAEASKKRLRLVTCIERRTRRPVATAPKP
mmetsp:Transcript_11653/g.38163  ORF Transcript_11653/g.38163 Transcript_11653/m.38163 type:complete len:491 (+) Transcript_11653:62-1534(+)